MSVQDPAFVAAVCAARDNDMAMCRFGDNCYRKLLDHVSQFRHAKYEAAVACYIQAEAAKKKDLTPSFAMPGAQSPPRAASTSAGAGGDASKPFDSFIMVCTGIMGTPRKAFEAMLVEHGATISKTVTSKTTHLIEGAQTQPSSAPSNKLARAQALGTRVVTEAWALDLVEKVGKKGGTASDVSKKRTAPDNAAPLPASKRPRVASQVVSGTDTMQDGDVVEVKSCSSTAVYRITRHAYNNYSCTCPAWRNQSRPVNLRTCKHLRQLRGDAAEEARIGAQLPTGTTVKSVRTMAANTNVTINGVLLAQKYDPAKHMIDGYYMSEKLDGMRAYWDGTQLMTRSGKVIHVPTFFLEGFPKDHHLDGELFAGRGQFDETVSIARSRVADGTPAADRWKKLKYMVFDCPSDTRGFEERLHACETQHVKDAPYASALEHTVCTDQAMLYAKLEAVEKAGGEGVMLRKPGSLYVHKRTTDLLKVKTFVDDEAIVCSVEAGKGKFKGMMGALVCKLRSGKQFKVGSGFLDKHRHQKWPAGTVITFRYFELTKAGVPRFPTYMRLRPDVDASEFKD